MIVYKKYVVCLLFCSLSCAASWFGQSKEAGTTEAATKQERKAVYARVREARKQVYRNFFARPEFRALLLQEGALMEQIDHCSYGAQLRDLEYKLQEVHVQIQKGLEEDARVQDLKIQELRDVLGAAAGKGEKVKDKAVEITRLEALLEKAMRASSDSGLLGLAQAVHEHVLEEAVMEIREQEGCCNSVVAAYKRKHFSSEGFDKIENEMGFLELIKQDVLEYQKK